MLPTPSPGCAPAAALTSLTVPWTASTWFESWASQTGERGNGGALGKDDLIIHEWGVFTVLNEAKYANANRKEEWGTANFFYRQFPKERLRWVPSAWDKPLIYVYSKAKPLQLRVKVTFAEGAPVVWWPAAVEPVDNEPGPQQINKGRPFRSLTWDAWVGDMAPVLNKLRGQAKVPLEKVVDFPLPGDSWLKEARLPDASRLTVIGNDPEKMRRFPGSLDRLETESFLYYDGLVPAPDYLLCEKVEATSVTLRNLAKFDIARLFVVDRRAKERVGFAFADATQQALEAGKTRALELKAVAAADWPGAAKKQIRQALLDTGLFAAEADSLLKIWHKGFLENDGITAFHILPSSEYDRRVRWRAALAPAAKPVRVGIALHPHLEMNPVQAQRVGPLIRQLDDPSFQKREAATKALIEMGPVAIGALRAALKQGVTLEMQRRLESILDRVDAIEWLNGAETSKKK